MRRLALGATLAGTALLSMGLTGPVAAHPSPRPGDVLAAAATHVQPGDHAEVTDGFDVVGHSDLGGGGLNADVWAHRGFAYVGVWSGPCPATGVKVVDYRRPASPRVVSVLPNEAGTSAEDVVVRQVSTKAFTGSLAVTGIQTCFELESPVFRGLAFFDVTKPSKPKALGRWEAPELSVGCHEVDLVQRRDGTVLAGCANVFAEQINGTDEMVLVDATDPAAPVTAGGFAIGADLGVDLENNPEDLGCFPASFDHSVRFVDRGTTLFASYWDYGALQLDVSDPSAPRLVGRADVAPPDEDGDLHSVVLADDEELLIANLEDFSPVDGCPEDGGWGEAHLFDTDDPRHPVHVGTFSTPNSESTRTDGFYSIHNTELVDDEQAISAWYSDGLVWWDFSDPANPFQVGQFVPPPVADPTGTLPEAPLVWGVYIDESRDLVLASDINSGLWIVQAEGLDDD